MIYNNLNRIKGILSARLGTLVPKLTPGGSVKVTKVSYNDALEKFFINDLYEVDAATADKYFKLLLNAQVGAEVSHSDSIDYPEYTIPENQEVISSGSSNQQVTATTSTTDKDILKGGNITLSKTGTNTPGNESGVVQPATVLPIANNPIQEVLKAEPSTILKNLNGDNPTTAIIGGMNTDPNRSVKDAAATQSELEKTMLLLEVKVTADNLQEKRQVASLNVDSSGMLLPINRQLIDTPLLTKRDIKQHNRVLLKDKRLFEREYNNTNNALNVSLVGLGLSLGIQVIGGAIGSLQAATDSNTTKNITAAWDGAASIASLFGPVGQAVGAIMGIAKGTGDIILGITGGTDQMTKTDLWMSSPLLSWNVGIINDFAAKKSNDFSVDANIMANVGSSYGGTAADLSEAADSAGKKYGLFSSKARRKANAAIEMAKSKLNLMGGIADDASDRRFMALSMGEQAGLAYSMMTDGGYNQKYTYAAKHGGLLEWNPVVELEWQPQVELNWELPTLKEGGSIDFVEELEWIPEFKSGGKTEEFDVPEIEETTQKNVIPEGALHKNKHHMEHAEGLTKKGIPVVDEEGEQQAEIEHSEIIFTLEVTKKLEEYYEIFYSEDSTNKEKEQAALDAGKLLVYQILENTEDRAGLIESCKKGGTLTFKKDTDDLVEEVLEWMPTVIIVETLEIEENKKEDKPEAIKELSDKNKMKEAIREVLIELLVK